MGKLKKVDFIVVHCSATRPSQDVGRTEIDRWHRTIGCFMVGYHYIIRRNGAIEEGRPSDEIGAHVRGWNHRSIGVCMVGGVDESMKPEDNFTDEQYATLKNILLVLTENHPKAKVQGHRDFPNVAKACPSFDVKSWWAKAKEPSA